MSNNTSVETFGETLSRLSSCDSLYELDCTLGRKEILQTIVKKDPQAVTFNDVIFLCRHGEESKLLSFIRRGMQLHHVFYALCNVHLKNVKHPSEDAIGDIVVLQCVEMFSQCTSIQIRTKIVNCIYIIAYELRELFFFGMHDEELRNLISMMWETRYSGRFSFIQLMATCGIQFDQIAASSRSDEPPSSLITHVIKNITANIILWQNNHTEMLAQDPQIIRYLFDNFTVTNEIMNTLFYSPHILRIYNLWKMAQSLDK